MTIGITKSLLYYQYGSLWESFFAELGCKVLLSEDTNELIFKTGSKDAQSECCLPAKAHMGHVCSLLRGNDCDYILSPYSAPKKGGEAICTRFWGMSDVLRYAYPDARLLEYAICEDDYEAQYKSFFEMGRKLGKKTKLVHNAYERAVSDQMRLNEEKHNAQARLLESDKLKILLTGRSYVLHDAYISGAVINILSELGAILVFSDHFDRSFTLPCSQAISPRLYWNANREATGAIASYKEKIDGVIMLSVFPCASDALACDMTIRKVNDLPITLIILDALQAEAGLQTRIESFIDIISERKLLGEK